MAAAARSSLWSGFSHPLEWLRVVKSWTAFASGDGWPRGIERWRTHLAEIFGIDFRSAYGHFFDVEPRTRLEGLMNPGKISKREASPLRKGRERPPSARANASDFYPYQSPT